MPPWAFDLIIGLVILVSAVMSLEKPLKGLISPNEESMIPAAILVVIGFLGAYSLAAFAGGRLSKLIHASPEIGVVDRLAGAVFGLARGALASILFILLMQQVLPENATPQPIAKSYSYPYLSGAASWIRSTVPGFVKSATEAIRDKPADETAGR
jgi:membrane protein required for colicin V production